MLGMNTVYDYCLVKLERSFFVDNITIKVVQMDDSFWGGNRGRNCTIAGFGKTFRDRQEGRRGDEKLYHSDVTAYQGVGACPCYRKSWLVGSAICFITGKEGKSVCPGDSGSPLVCDERQAGIASHMYSGTKCDLFSMQEFSYFGCGMEGSVNVYNYVCPILTWLRQHVGTIIPKKPTYC